MARTLLLAAAAVAAYLLLTLFDEPARADGGRDLGPLTHPPSVAAPGSGLGGCVPDARGLLAAPPTGPAFAGRCPGVAPLPG